MQSFVPFHTMVSVSEAAADAAADAADAEKASAQATGDAAGASDEGSSGQLRTVVERFWLPANQGVKLFQGAGYP